MHTFLDAKVMARTLRTALSDRGIHLTHSESLELVARQFGLDDWNTLSARIERGHPRRLPPGWRPHHSAAYPLHEMGTDPSDPAAITIVASASSDVVGGNFATLMQSISAEDYRGRVLRLTAELRGEDTGSGTLWMRVDPKGGGSTIRFDNMLTRGRDGALSGRFGWTERSIVLDVPADAGTIHFGPMLKGGGQLWARRLSLDVVPDNTATTDTGYPRRPTDLGFGDVA